MAEIVNLRLARKRKKREEAAVEAGANRLKFGAPKAERELDKARRELAQRALDARRRETGDDA